MNGPLDYVVALMCSALIAGGLVFLGCVIEYVYSGKVTRVMSREEYEAYKGVVYDVHVIDHELELLAVTVRK